MHSDTPSDFFNISDQRLIEVRGFKWPQRRTSVAQARLIGMDGGFGRWLGVSSGSPWWATDGSDRGVFDRSFIKLVPSGTFWTACFNSVDPVIDVDIVLPVRWLDDVLEEIDLELDVLGFADGTIRVRDQDEFERVRQIWSMPDEIVAQAEATCAFVRAQIERGAEPFGSVGRAWLTRFLADTAALQP